MNLLDYIMIGILIISTLIGFKKGFINSIVAFIGTILILILGFYLKNPISSFIYDKLPFISIGGKFEGMSIVNILIYEGISYLIIIVILGFILGIIVKISGIFNKIVNSTVILTLPSKLLGALCGLIEGVIITFALVFIISLVSPLSSLYNNSKYADSFITKVPILSSKVKNTYNSVSEIYNISILNKDKKDKNEANLEGLNALLKYEILTPASAQKLIDKGKLKIEGAEEVINKYLKEDKND